MAFIQRKERRPVIDLQGPDGNAFAIMGYASRFAKDLGRDPKPIIEEMRSGDYANVVNVFEREFGEFVDIVR